MSTADTIAAKASPPIVVTGLAIAGVSLQEWVYVLTIVYLILQIGHFVWSKFFKKDK